MQNNKPQDIAERTFMLASKVINFARILSKNQVNSILLGQLIRSCTSIGANIEEARGAHTKSDFTYCMNIAKKEARETLYWLKLLIEANPNLETKLSPLVKETEEVLKILTSIVKNSNPRKF